MQTGKLVSMYAAVSAIAAFSVCRLGIDFPHDVDIPLINNIPACSLDSIVDTLFFPESTLCTLAVADLNDSILRVYTLPNSADPLADLAPWEEAAKQVTAGLSDKQVILGLAGKEMGIMTGFFVIQDEQDGRCVVPYTVKKVLYDSFDNVLTNNAFWNAFNPSDQIHYKQGTPGQKLRFIFPQNDTTTRQSAGVLSSFRVSGDFKMQVGFKLRDDMLNGFSVGFLLTTAADTSRWVERAGIYLSGNGDNNSAWVTLNAGVGITMARKEMDTYEGVLGIQRSQGKVLFIIKDSDPMAIADTIDKNFTFPRDSICVQFRMSVDDFNRNRHCEWDNFYLSAGTVSF
jgi:hypothetical protein